MRLVVDRGVRYLLLISALVSIFVVFLIFLFTLREGWPALSGIGLRVALGEIGYPVYAANKRALVRASEGKLHEEVEHALVASEGTLQEAVKVALEGVDAGELQAEIGRAGNLHEDIERALDVESEAELRDAVKVVLQKGVYVALQERVGFRFPPWASGAVLDVVGLHTFLTGGEWRPDYDKLGIRLMIVGSVFITIGAVALGLPIDSRLPRA